MAFEETPAQQLAERLPEAALGGANDTEQHIRIGGTLHQQQHGDGPADLVRGKEPTGQQQATRIETDQKTGAIRFIVNGREEARIDATGLHVRQDVAYGGDLTDTGEAYYDTPVKEPKH